MNLYDILTADDVVSSINNNIDYLLEIIPELKLIIGFEHKNPHHHLDVWGHTLYALSLSENDFEVRLSLLLHDIGKPLSFQDGKVRSFKNHSKVSSVMTSIIVNRLGYKKCFSDEVCKLVEYHDTHINSDDIKDDYDFYFKLYKIQYCDALAHHPDKLKVRKRYLDSLLRKFEEYNCDKKCKLNN